MISVLEKKLKKHIPLEHFLITGFSRNAFYLLLKAYDWDKDSEIIIPAFTCSVIPSTVKAAGYRFVPVEPEEGGLNIDPEGIQKAITKNTKAIYVVHTYGTAAKMNVICEIAKMHNLIVIEDLAHALFSSYKNKKLGTFGDYAILSFTKKIINFEGGAVGTNNTEIFEKMQKIQSEIQQPRRLNITSILDKYGRLYSSYWESRFPLWILATNRIHYIFYILFLYDKVYEKFFWIQVDKTKFKPSKISALITSWQIDSFTRKNKKIDYFKFKEKYKNKITCWDVGIGDTDTPPAYYSGTFKKNNWLLKWMCTPTWVNFNDPGKYPRADFLYGNYKIFTRFIMRL